MSSISLILASRSPRRAALLREAGYAFEVMPSPFDDPAAPVPIDGRSAESMAIDLATKKAHALGEQLSSPSLVIAADTIILQNDAIIGTPRSDDEARAILDRLAGNTHHVISGVCLLLVNDDRASNNKMWTFADSAEVMFGPIENDVLHDYIRHSAWRGKAGGYNLFEVDRWLTSVDGDPTTVVGLPMKKLMQALSEFSILKKSGD